MRDYWKDVIIVCSTVISISSLLYAYKQSNKLTDLSPPKSNVSELIGNTPMVLIRSLSRETNCNIYAKLELYNPGGSSKDRMALSIIRSLESSGEIRPNVDDTIFEGTSGSTGISLAMIGNSLGYRTHISLPDDTSSEKVSLLSSLGATVNRVKPASISDPDQYVNASFKACETFNHDNHISHGVFANQFENVSNWKIHYESTGPEIYRQLGGKITAFIAGCGTGGTISGVSKFLKQKLGNRVKTVLADPQGSGFYNRITYGVMYSAVEKEGTRRRHQVDTIVEGVGLSRITQNFLAGEAYIDDAIKVSDLQAIKMAKFLSVNDGLFIGSSTAVNAVAAVKLSKKLLPNSNIVIIACDSGSRHLSKFWKEALLVNSKISLEEVMI